MYRAFSAWSANPIGPSLSPEQSAQYAQAGCRIRQRKPYPTERHKMEREQYPGPACRTAQSGPLIEILIKRAGTVRKQFVDEKPQSMPHAPDHEVDSDAVPQPNRHHRRDLCSQHHHRRRRLVGTVQQPARERREHVGAHPVAERHMPALPERRDIVFEVRAIKVFRQGDTKQSTQTNRDIRIAAEVKINAKSVSVNEYP